MYYASTYVHLPKSKATVSVVTTDGEIFDGCFFVSGDQRIKDLLNGESDFLPFETLGGAIYILNRKTISRVMPRARNVEHLNGLRDESDAPKLGRTG